MQIGLAAFDYGASGLLDQSVGFIADCAGMSSKGRLLSQRLAATLRCAGNILNCCPWCIRAAQASFGYFGLTEPSTEPVLTVTLRLMNAHRRVPTKPVLDRAGTRLERRAMILILRSYVRGL